MILLIGASVSGIQVNNNNVAPTKYSWSDNFDSYTLDQFLDGGGDDGGWKGWDNDPQFGAFVTDDQARSTPHSVEIVDNVDLVREYSGLTSGQFTYIAYVYVPSDFVGLSYFILLSDYTDGGGTNNLWAVQIRIDADQGIIESEYDEMSLWLVYDQWVEIRCEIDLDADWLEMYYDDDLLHEKAWTSGVNNDGTGLLEIDAVDLFANAATVVWYDDFSLEGGGATPIPALSCDGDLNWVDVDPGATVTGSFDVGNVGEVGSFLNWVIESEPEWGTWTLTPSSGTGLPDGDWTTVNVEVVTPLEGEGHEFTGKVKVANTDNPSDFCEIDVYLMTPRSRSHQFPILQGILERFPVLQQILGL